MMKTGRPRSASGIDRKAAAAVRATPRSRESLVRRLKGAIAHDAVADVASAQEWPFPDNDAFERDAVAVTRAVQRLAYRLRAMDDGARRALTDLDSHLDEIIRRLRDVTRTSDKPADLTAALRRVAAIVDRLSRDIDNADETARSSVEGLPTGASRKQRDPEADGVADAIRDLNAQIASMSECLQAPTVDKPEEDWKSIGSRVDHLLAEASQATSRRKIDEAPRLLDDGGESAEERLAASASATGSASAPHGRPGERRIARSVVDDEVRRASSARDRRQAEAPPPDAPGALAKQFAKSRIAGRQDAIERLERCVAELARTIDAAGNAAARPASADGAAIARLETRLAALDERIERHAGQKSSVDAMPEICRRLEALGRQLAGVPAAIDTVRSQLADLRHDLAERDAQRFAGIDAQIGALVSRFDKLAAASPGGADNPSRAEGLAPDDRDETAGADRRAARAFVREMVAAASCDDGTPAASAGQASLPGVAEATDRLSEHAPDSIPEQHTGVVAGQNRLEDDRTAQPVTARVRGSNDVKPWPDWAAVDDPAGGQPGTVAAPVGRRPSESRMNRLNIAALRELARHTANGPDGTAGDRKADFIAAARRAAQAGAAEPRSTEAGGIEAKPSALARIGAAVRDRKRALLLLVPVLLVALAASMIGKGVDTAGAPVADAVTTGDQTASIAKSKLPEVASEPATAASEPAPVAAKATAEPPIVFALPEPRGSRFAASPDAPPTITFVGADMADMPPLDDTIGRPGLRAAAASGDTNAAVEIAARYAEGRVVKRDLAKAAYWYERAANDGIAVAQYRLASLYERGQGVEMDRATAKAWYRKAADLGSVGAMHNLAVMLSDGAEGVPKHAEALKYFRAAADRGVADSQYNLGIIYARGPGVTMDLVESYKWFALAAAGGDAEAKANRDEIGKLLSSDERVEARRAAAAWRPHPLVAEANPGTAVHDLWDAATADISEADRRALVRKIQKLLAERGYDPGPADGVPGAQTQAAVRAYQRDTGLAETGKINRDLVAALVKPSR